MNDILLDRVQELVSRARKLRMKSVAIPIGDLEAILRLCDVEKDTHTTESATGRYVKTTQHRSADYSDEIGMNE